MTIRGDIKKAVETWGRHGTRKVLGDILLALQVRAQARHEANFDARYDVQTSGITHLTGLTIKSANATFGSEYVPSPGRLVDYALSRLPDALHHYTFIDFGSGKGRIILRASMRGFKRVIGVEFAQELFEMSQRNLDAFTATNGNRCPVEARLIDATDFEIPDGPCAFFLYNPFRKAVMERVLENIRASYRNDPRKFFIIHLALRDEGDNEADANRQLLEEQDFIVRAGRVSSMRDLWMRILFSQFRLDVFETIDIPCRMATPRAEVSKSLDVPWARPVKYAAKRDEHSTPAA